MDSLIIFCAKYLVLFVFLIMLITWWQLDKKHKKEFIITLVISGIIALILTMVADKLYYNPRPFVSQNIKPLFPHGTDNGFPSDHTVLAMTITSVIFYFKRPLAYAAFILTIGVGLGRVLAHVHSPVDILGGLVIGAAAAFIGHWFVSKYFGRHHLPPTQNHAS